MTLKQSWNLDGLAIFQPLSDFIAIYVLYYVYIFVHAAKIKWTFVLPIACVESTVESNYPQNGTL